MLRITLLVLLACGSPPRASRALAIDPPIRIGDHVLTPAMVKARLAAINPPARGGRVYCAYDAVGSDARAAYLWVLCEEHASDRDEALSGSSLPLVLDLEGIHVPRDGGLYGPDVHRMFPAALLPDLELDTAAANARVAALAAAIRHDITAETAR